MMPYTIKAVSLVTLVPGARGGLTSWCIIVGGRWEAGWMVMLKCLHVENIYLCFLEKSRTRYIDICKITFCTVTLLFLS